MQWMGQEGRIDWKKTTLRASQMSDPTSEEDGSEEELEPKRGQKSIFRTTPAIQRFYEYLNILRDQTTATTLRQFVKNCLDTLPIVPGVAGPGPGVLLPSTGPGNHGIRHTSGLSLGLIFQHFLAEMDDYMSTEQSLDNLRARPGVPGAASFFMLLKKDSMFKEKHWTANLEVIGATFVSLFRSTYCEFDEFIGALCYYYLRQSAGVGPPRAPHVAAAELLHRRGQGREPQVGARILAPLHRVLSIRQCCCGKPSWARPPLQRLAA